MTMTMTHDHDHGHRSCLRRDAGLLVVALLAMACCGIVGNGEIFARQAMSGAGTLIPLVHAGYNDAINVVVH